LEEVEARAVQEEPVPEADEAQVVAALVAVALAPQTSDLPLVQREAAAGDQTSGASTEPTLAVGNVLTSVEAGLARVLAADSDRT
jgi:hypothetical protein